jgi:hypothetical protein
MILFFNQDAKAAVLHNSRLLRVLPLGAGKSGDELAQWSI